MSTRIRKFFFRKLFLRMRKFSRPHAAYSNRFQPSARINLYPEIDKIVPPCACPSWSRPESPSVMVRSFLTLLCPLFINNNLKTSCRTLTYWLCKFITAAFICTHDIKLEIRATNKEVTTLLYAMFVYNARREDWIQQNDE